MYDFHKLSPQVETNDLVGWSCFGCAAIARLQGARPPALVLRAADGVPASVKHGREAPPTDLETLAERGARIRPHASQR